jgi:hypothetical protein
MQIKTPNFTFIIFLTPKRADLKEKLNIQYCVRGLASQLPCPLINTIHAHLFFSEVMKILNHLWLLDTQSTNSRASHGLSCPMHSICSSIQLIWIGLDKLSQEFRLGTSQLPLGLID